MLMPDAKRKTKTDEETALCHKVTAKKTGTGTVDTDTRQKENIKGARKVVGRRMTVTAIYATQRLITPVTHPTDRRNRSEPGTDSATGLSLPAPPIMKLLRKTGAGTIGLNTHPRTAKGATESPRLMTL